MAGCRRDFANLAHTSSNHRIAQKVSKTAKGKRALTPKDKRKPNWPSNARSTGPRFYPLRFRPPPQISGWSYLAPFNIAHLSLIMIHVAGCRRDFENLAHTTSNRRIAQRVSNTAKGKEP